MGSSKENGLLQAKIQGNHLNPSAMGLTTKWTGSHFDFTADANLKGSSIHNMTGTLHVKDFKQTSPDGNYMLPSKMTYTIYKSHLVKRFLVLVVLLGRFDLGHDGFLQDFCEP